MTGPGEVAAGVQLASAVWGLADNQDLLTRVLDFFRTKHTILVLGSTGTGKSNLIRSLNAAAGLVDAIPSGTRTEAVQPHKVRVNSSPFRVIDTPGQRHHQSERTRAIREALATPPVRVINVVSYGYHEYGQASSEALDANDQPRPDYLDRHRSNELHAIREWLPLLGDRTVTAYVCTVVTKADLWWSERDDVTRYYQEGEYAAAIQQADPHLTHAVLPYCSVVHKFYGRSRLSGDFDDEARVSTTSHFLSQLVALA